MAKKSKRIKLPGAPAWAWKIQDDLGHWSLCHWADPTYDELFDCDRPSDEAKAVRVRIVEVAELKKIMEQDHGKDTDS